MKTLLCALVAAVTLVATAQSVSPPIYPVPRPDRLCGPVCLIFCEYGNVLDARGCPTCQCNEHPTPPKPVCSGLRLCKMLCPFGNVKDSNGCDLCRCKPRPHPIDPVPCPQVRCARPCPGGFRTTDKGCQTCQCKPTPKPLCSLRQCRMRCPYGNVQDSNGCDLCRCKPRPQPIGCRLDNGTLLTDKRPGDSFQLDPCTRCNCNSRGDVTCSAVACSWPICDNPPVIVKGQCCPSCPQGSGCKLPNGTLLTDKRPGDSFQLDPCTLCDCGADSNVFCAVRDCARPPCDNPVSVKDRCCPVCPTVPVKPVCGPLCRMGCPNGFVTGRDGCPICKCKPVTVPTSCPRQCRIHCALAGIRRSFQRRRSDKPTGCDCNCPVRPRYATRN